ncbi:MAG: hypothetical protein IPF61_05245 [Xanthomonadales bacterium]|nr:hypothetical protein [Xanthomonadales bacterium]
MASFDLKFRVARHDCSVWWEKGVQEYVVDSIWSSPSIVDLDGNGTLDIVVGADSNFHQLAGIHPCLTEACRRAMQGNGSGELPGFRSCMTKWCTHRRPLATFAGSKRRYP